MKKIITFFLFLMCVPSAALFAQQEKPVSISTWYELNLEHPLNLPLKSFFLNDLGSYNRSFFYPTNFYRTEKLAMECIEEEYRKPWTDEEWEDEEWKNGEWQKAEKFKRCQENAIDDSDLASALGLMQFPVFSHPEDEKIYKEEIKTDSTMVSVLDEKSKEWVSKKVSKFDDPWYRRPTNDKIEYSIVLKETLFYYPKKDSIARPLYYPHHTSVGVKIAKMNGEPMNDYYFFYADLLDFLMGSLPNYFYTDYANFYWGGTSKWINPYNPFDKRLFATAFLNRYFDAKIIAYQEGAKDAKKVEIKQASQLLGLHTKYKNYPKLIRQLPYHHTFSANETLESYASETYYEKEEYYDNALGVNKLKTNIINEKNRQLLQCRTYTKDRQNQKVLPFLNDLLKREYWQAGYASIDSSYLSRIKQGSFGIKDIDSLDFFMEFDLTQPSKAIMVMRLYLPHEDKKNLSYPAPHLNFSYQKSYRNSAISLNYLNALYEQEDIRRVQNEVFAAVVGNSASAGKHGYIGDIMSEYLQNSKHIFAQKDTAKVLQHLAQVADKKHLFNACYLLDNSRNSTFAQQLITVLFKSVTIGILRPFQANGYNRMSYEDFMERLSKTTIDTTNLSGKEWLVDANWEIEMMVHYFWDTKQRKASNSLIYPYQDWESPTQISIYRTNPKEKNERTLIVNFSVNEVLENVFKDDEYLRNHTNIDTKHLRQTFETRNFYGKIQWFHHPITGAYITYSPESLKIIQHYYRLYPQVAKGVVVEGKL